jgi:hypothetical protein
MNKKRKILTLAALAVFGVIIALHYIGRSGPNDENTIIGDIRMPLFVLAVFYVGLFVILTGRKENRNSLNVARRKPNAAERDEWDTARIAEPGEEWRYESRSGGSYFQLYLGDFVVGTIQKESIAKSIVDEGNAAIAANEPFDPWERTFASREREIAE